jgi:hypothetical protein
MEWIIAYLISVIVVPIVYAAVVAECSREMFSISDSETAFMAFIMSVVWPLALMMDITVKWKVRHQYSIKCRISEVGEAIKHIDTHDRTALVSMSESDLKFIAKMYRKNQANLTTAQFEMVRDELVNRMTEKALFK